LLQLSGHLHSDNIFVVASIRSSVFRQYFRCFSWFG